MSEDSGFSRVEHPHSLRHSLNSQLNPCLVSESPRGLLNLGTIPPVCVGPVEVLHSLQLWHDPSAVARAIGSVVWLDAR